MDYLRILLVFYVSLNNSLPNLWDSEEPHSNPLYILGNA